MGSGADFAVFFHLVVMFAQDVGEIIGGPDFGDRFCGEEAGEAFLPELVSALDFAFCLGSGGIAEGDAIKAEGGAKLREGLGSMSKEDAVVIDIEAQRQPVGLKDTAEKIEVSQESFALVEAGAQNDAAVVIKDMKQKGLPILAFKPSVGRGIVLPELAYLLGLPAADRFARGLAGPNGQSIAESKAANSGAVDFVFEAAECLGGDHAVGTAGLEQLANKGLNFIGPSGAAISAGEAGSPEMGFALGDGQQIVAVKLIEPARAYPELAGGLLGRNCLVSKLAAEIADERSAQA